MSIEGKTIAILISSHGTEEPEFAQPKEALEKAGATITVISAEAGTVKTVNSDLDPGGEYRSTRVLLRYRLKRAVAWSSKGGCVRADTLRGNGDIVAFARAFFEQKKPVGAICHALRVLIEAGAVDGRHLASCPTLRTDLRNAGARWSDEEVVVDQGLVSSRDSNDLPAFCAKLAGEIGEGRHEAQARSV